MPIFDAHIDYAMPALDARDAPNAPQVTPERIRRLSGALLSVWSRWREYEGSPARAWDVIEAGIAHNAVLGRITRSREDLGDESVFLHHVEGIDVLGATNCAEDMLRDLDRLFALGVRSITPIYSHGNAFGGGSNQPDGPGLTELGVELLDHMLELGMLIDTAHMNLHTRADVLAWAQSSASRRPLVSYTHGALVSTVRFADAHQQERGITLEQAEEIRAHGGIVALAVSRPFVGSLSEFDDTLDLLLQSPLGSRGLGIGSDFGGVGPSELFPGATNHDEVDLHLRERVERGELSEDTYEDVTHRNMETLVEGVLR